MPAVLLHNPTGLVTHDSSEVLQDSTNNGVHYSGPGLEAAGYSIAELVYSYLSGQQLQENPFQQ